MHYQYDLLDDNVFFRIRQILTKRAYQSNHLVTGKLFQLQDRYNSIEFQ